MQAGKAERASKATNKMTTAAANQIRLELRISPRARNASLNAKVIRVPPLHWRNESEPLSLKPNTLKGLEQVWL